MAKVEIVGAFINGNAPGTTVEVSDKEAAHLESIGYAHVVKETPKPRSKAKAKAKETETSEEKE